MPFHDDNAIEDIMGRDLVASHWREGESEAGIHRQLSEFVDRIRDKLTRNRNQTRGNWFTIGLDHAQQAQQQYRDGQFEAGR